MVKMLTTILAPTAGTARVAGFDVVAEQDEVRARIGVALQEVGLDPLMTAREMLVLQSRLFSADSAAARAKAERLLKTVGLDDVDPKKRVGQFSGGMKRRLDLALALVNDPDILFLDEPTTGLDPVSRLAIWEEVRRLNAERGMTIFLTTQYLEEADKLADEVAIIDRGKIVAQGRPACSQEGDRERGGDPHASRRRRLARASRRGAGGAGAAATAVGARPALLLHGRRRQAARVWSGPWTRPGSRSRASP